MRAKTSMLCSGQLLCIARALLQRAKVLVLDEATAGVDPDTAACLQRALKRELQDCTVSHDHHKNYLCI
jgi:ATP-binding cassette subfamily C (CFTR/MRP) protein 1